MPLVFCSRCGAHGTSVAKNLCKTCPAAGPSAEQAGNKSTFRRQARLVARRLHPSRKDTPLEDVRPLVVRAPAQLPAPTAGHDDAPAASAGAHAAPAARVAAAAAAASPPPPPRKRNRPVRVSDADIEGLQLEQECEYRPEPPEVGGDRVMLQLAADEADASAAAVAADRGAAGIKDGRLAGTVSIEVFLPEAAGADDGDYEMGLIDPCEGF